MRISAFLRDDGACGFYRVSQPLDFVAKKSKIETLYIRQGDSHDKIAKGLEADVIIAPRLSEPFFTKTLKELQNMGKRIVVDYDDNMFDISPLSPHYEEHGTEDVNFTMPDGKVVPVWEDGKNLDVKANKVKLEGVKEALSMADMVTVTTDKLAEFYREYNNNVVVLPNCVDMELWKPLPFKESDEIRIFWAGGHSHYEDWVLLSDVMPKVMEKYPQVRLVLMGAKFDGTLKNISKDRIEFHPWVHTQAYPYKVAALNPTIGIIPLQNTRFNQCKSPIKWLEMASLAVPCVTSLVSPYKEVMNDDNGIFIEGNDPDGWVTGISMLVEDRILRGKIGGSAQETVRSNFDINNKYIQWIEKYKELIDGGSHCSDLSIVNN